MARCSPLARPCDRLPRTWPRIAHTTRRPTARREWLATSRARERARAASGARLWPQAVARGVALFFGLFSLFNLIAELRRPGFDENVWWLDLRPLPATVTTIILALAGAPAGVVGAEAGEGRLASRRDAGHCRRPQPGRAAQRRDVLPRLGSGADSAVDAAAVVVRAGGCAPLHRLGRGAARAGAPRALHGAAGRGGAGLVRHPLSAGAAGLLRQDDLRAAGAGGSCFRRPGAQQRAAFHQPRRPRAHGRAALQGRPHASGYSCRGPRVRANRSTRRR